MTPKAEARLLGRAVRRFDIPPDKLDEVIRTLYDFMRDESLKPALRMDAAKSLMVAESLNQKDEHKILSLLSPNAATEQEGNRFLDATGGTGIQSGNVEVRAS